jgi:hypothetical protein
MRKKIVTTVLILGHIHVHTDMGKQIHPEIYITDKTNYFLPIHIYLYLHIHT